jgi:hypothetical protein
METAVQAFARAFFGFVASASLTTAFMVLLAA